MTVQNHVILPQNDSVLLIRNSLMSLVDYDYTAAAYVSQILYWREKMGKQFYKTDQSFATELHISIHSFRRLKHRILAKLTFISTELKQIPARTHYEVDFNLLNSALASLKAPKENSPKATNNHRLSKSAPTSICTDAPTRLSKSADSITENKTEIIKKTTTTKNPVEVDLALFSQQEKNAAKKQLSKLTDPQQVAVLDVMQMALKSKNIKSKIGYLQAVVKSVLDDTFTPVVPAKKLLTPAEKLQKAQEQQAAEAQRDEFAKQQYMQQQAAYKKAQEQAGKKAEPKPHTPFPLHSVLKKLRA